MERNSGTPEVAPPLQPLATKRLFEQPSADSMEVTTSTGRACTKRNRSPVVDLSACDSPAPVVWDPDNDLGNTIHRNKRYLSEVMANDLSRHMVLDSTAIANMQHRSHSSSVSPPLLQPPTSPTSVSAYRNVTNSPSCERLRSPTPDPVSSESMDARSPDVMATEAATQSVRITAPAASLQEGNASSLPPTGRTNRSNELHLNRPPPISRPLNGMRELHAGPAPPVPGAMGSSNYDFSPGSPTDLRLGFDLRKTALLRSLLNRAEDVSNLMVSDDTAVQLDSRLPQNGKLQKQVNSTAKPRWTNSTTVLMDMPQAGSMGEGANNMLGAGNSTQLISQPPSQAGFSRMGTTNLQTAGSMLESANSASMDTTSSSSSGEDHRLEMPSGQPQKHRSTAVSSCSLFPKQPIRWPEVASNLDPNTAPAVISSSPQETSFQTCDGNGVDLNEWQMAQVRAKAMVHSSASLDGNHVVHANMHLVGVVGSLPPVTAAPKSSTFAKPAPGML